MKQGLLDLGDRPLIQKFPTSPIVREATIDGGCRFLARRAWGSGPHIHWHLINPSDADARRDDPTMLRMIGFSFRWGFGSLSVTNFYPCIASQQILMRSWRARRRAGDADKVRAWQRNVATVAEEMNRPGVPHVAAWGNGVEQPDLEEFWSDVCLKMDEDAPVIEWKCLGTNDDGSPIHPLARGKHRVPDNATLRPWGVK